MRTHPFDSVEPVDLAWKDVPEGRGRIMAISWSDGHHSTYKPSYLRKICPCAECKGTHTGKPKAFNILNARQAAGIHREIEIVSVEPVGNYAIAFAWGDGHREGIYSWSYLRAMSPEQESARKGSQESEPT